MPRTLICNTFKSDALTPQVYRQTLQHAATPAGMVRARPTLSMNQPLATPRFNTLLLHSQSVHFTPGFQPEAMTACDEKKWPVVHSSFLSSFPLSR